jgi:hypothetical protein
MAHLLERFEAAVHALIGDGPVKQRLVQAYSEHLEDLRDLDLPVNANGAFTELHAALHRVAPSGKETPVKASVQKMSAGEAAWHAETILGLYAELLSQARRPEPLRVVEAAPEPTPPRYLVRKA